MARTLKTVPRESPAARRRTVPGGKTGADRIPKLKIDLIRRPGTGPLPLAALRTFLGQVARKAGSTADQVTVVFAGDPEVQDLNRRFRGKDRPTDVLSFPGDRLADGGHHQGEMIVSVVRAASQAAQRHHSLEIELRYLLIHGFLHLMGYDHESDEGEMEAEERRLRELLMGAKQATTRPTVRAKQ